MRVLLISANTLTAPYPVYPLGLDYVAGAISAKHQVKIADVNDFEDFNDLRAIIRDFGPNIIGLSLRNVDNTDTTDSRGFVGIYRNLIEVIRKSSEAPVVLGGSGFTIFPAEMMAALQADYGIIGEGERLALLLDALEAQKEVFDIPGVIARDSRACMPEPWAASFGRLIDQDNSHLKFYLQKGGMLNLQTKRGCNFKCIYCTYPYIEGKNLRLIPPAEIAETALRLQHCGAKYLFVTDSAFNADYSHSMAVAREFIKHGVSIPWGSFFAPTRAPEGYYQLMADAGLTHVEFGTESLSDKILASYRKPFSTKHVYEAHRNAVRAGLYVAHYFLLGGPGENGDTLSETLINVDKLEKTVLFFFCGIRIYPHTALYDLAVESGQITGSQDLLEPVFYQSESISSEEIVKRVQHQADGRMNWVIGAGGDETARIVAGMFARGHSGPLWEYLIQ
jgi:radical SAM superfamily enzyme YgiQ (UPF0313 family)